MNIKNKAKGSKDYIILFFICLIPRLFVNMQVPFLSIISDEVSTMSAGSVFAGYDWGNVCNNAGYYGGGATALLAPILKLVDNSVIMYQVLLGIYAMQQAVVAPIAYKICRKHLYIEDKKLAYLLSIIASFVVVKRSTTMINETPLGLCTWVIALLLFELYDADKRKKMKLTVLLCLILTYATTLHTRAITYTIALFIMIVLVWIYNRKIIIDVKVFAGIYALGYLIANQFTDFMKNIYFTYDTSAILRNSEVNLDRASGILKVENIQTVYTLLLGPVTTANVLTGGIFILAYVAGVHFFLQIITKKNKQCEEKQFLVFAFFLGCMLMTIFGFVITWMQTTSAAINAGVLGTLYGLKGVTYIRYFGVYLGPCILLALAHVLKNNIKVLYFVSCGITYLFTILFAFTILPYICVSKSGIEVFLPFMLANNSTVMPTFGLYAIGLLVCMVASTVVSYLMYKKKINIALIIMIVLMLHQYVHNGIYIDATTAHAYSDKRVETYNELYKEYDLIPDVVYIEDADKSMSDDHQIFYTYQLLFKDKVIEIGKPEVSEEAAIYITNQKNKYGDSYNHGFKMLELENETDFVFIRGEELIQQFENTGFVFEDRDKTEFEITFKLTQIEMNIEEGAIFEEVELEIEEVIDDGDQEVYEAGFSDLDGIEELVEEIQYIEAWSSVNIELERGTYQLYNMNKDLELYIKNEDQEWEEIVRTNDEGNHFFAISGEKERIKFWVYDTEWTGEPIICEKVGEYEISTELDAGILLERLSGLEKIHVLDMVGVGFEKTKINVDYIGIMELPLLEEGALLLMEKSDTNTMTVNFHTELIEEFNSYYLMAKKSDIILEFDNDSYVMLENSIGLGKYIISLNDSEIEEVQLVANGYKSEIFQVTDGVVEIEVPYALEKWYLRSEGKRILLNNIQAKNVTAKVYSEYLKVLESVEVGETLFVLDDLIESEGVENIIHEKIEEQEIQVEELIEDSRYILLRRDQRVSNYYSTHLPLAMNERYVLMENNSTYKDIKVEYLVNDSGTGIEVPLGTYELTIEIELKRDDFEERVVDIYNGDSKLGTTARIPTDEEMEAGIMILNYQISGYSSRSDVKCSIASSDYNKEVAQIVGLEYIANYARINFQEYSEDEDELNVPAGEELRIGGRYFAKGSYEVELIYEGTDSQFEFGIYTQDGIVMDYNISDNSVETEEGMSLKIQINPSNDRANASLLITNLGEATVNIKEIKIIKN